MSGTILGTPQLNAAAFGPGHVVVAGIFVYTPSSGTVLERTESLPLALQFTPSDNANYESVSANNSIRVLNSAPQFSSVATVPELTVSGIPISFTASATDTDGDSLQYQWTFGDGGTGTGTVPNHTYADSGTYTVEVTITDGHGGSAETTLIVNISAGLLVSKGTVALNFKKINADKIAVAGKFKSVPGPQAKNSAMTIAIGDQTAAANFDSKGRVKIAGVLLTVTSSKAGVSKFSLTWSKTRFNLGLMGFINATVRKTPATLPVQFTIGSKSFQTVVPMTYTATAGKSGAGKLLISK